MFFLIFSRKKQLFIWESEIFVRLWGDVNLDKNGGLPAWRRGKAGKNWADGLREAVHLAFKEAKKGRKSGLPAWRRGRAGKNWADGLREAVHLAFKEAKKGRKSGLLAGRRGKAGKNWADGLREAVCLAFKEAKKERKRGPAWRKGKVRKYYPENTMVFSG